MECVAEINGIRTPAPVILHAPQKSSRQNPQEQAAMAHYTRSLDALVSLLGLNSMISMIRISNSGTDKERRMWKRQMEENFTKLKTYWFESEEKGIDGYETYQSYKELLNIRWKGCIQKKTREYHLNQLNSFCKYIELEEKIDMLLRSFSASLLHHQFMILKTPGTLSPLNITFVPPAPLIPPHLLKARINLRSMPEGATHISSPPWSAKALLTVHQKEVKPFITGWGNLANLRSAIKPGMLHIGDAKNAARIRSDFYSI